MDKLYYSTRNIHVFKCSISAQNTFIFFFCIQAIYSPRPARLIYHETWMT